MAWKVKTKEFQGAGKDMFHLINEEEMVCLVEKFFPNYDTDLSTIPHLTRIPRKYFFPDQKIEEKGKIVKTDDDAYDAEVMQVLRCLSEVKTLTGLAFHSYNRKLAKQTFSNIKGDFEVDWILINHAGIFVIEVGLAASDSNPESIIDAKVDQIIRKTRKIIEFMIESTGKTHLLENDVKYVVALPNVSIQNVKLWMEDEDHRTQLENFEPDIFFFTQETLIRHNLYRGTSLGEVELERLFTNSIAETVNQTDAAFKYIASLILHSNLATRTPDKSNYQPKKAEFKYATKQLNFEYPEDIVLSPEQQDVLKDIVFGKPRAILLFGDAGTGKTTVLQLLLVYYAGKKSAEKLEVIFFIPEHKWAFSLFMEHFIEEHCHQHLVKIVPSLEQLELEKIRWQHKDKPRVLILLDEFYESVLYNTLEKIWRTPNTRMVFSFVKSGDENLDKDKGHVFAPFMTRYFLRLCFRSSTHLFSPAAKLKRSIAASSVEHYSHYAHLSSARTFGVFYSGRTQLKITYTPLDEKFVIVLNEDLVIVYGDAAITRIDSLSTVHFVNPEMEVEELDFTGIEAGSVAIVLEPKLFESGTISKKQRLFLYNAITRARSDVVILSSPDAIKSVRGEIDLDESDKLLELVQQGKTVKAEELWRFYQQFDKEKRREIEILVALSCNRELVINFLSPLKSRTLEHDSLLASLLGFALLQQQTSDLLFEFIDYLIELFFYRPYCQHKDKIIIYAFGRHSLNPELVDRYGDYLSFGMLELRAELHDPFGNELFMLSACTYGTFHLLQQLLESEEFKITASNKSFFELALEHLIHRNNAAAVQLLIPKLKQTDLDSFRFFLRDKPRGKEALVLFLDAFPNMLATISDSHGNSMLHKACNSEDVAIFDEILKRRPVALSQKNNNGATPVDVAFDLNSSDIVYFAVENYWEELKLMRSFYPLSYFLSALGELEKLKNLLLESPEQLWKRASDGVDILGAACISGKISVVEWLIIEHPEIVSAQPANYWPISYACFFEYLDIVNILLKFDKKMLYCRSIETNASLLHVTANAGVTEIAQFLLQEDERQELIYSLDNEGRLPLIDAYRANHLEMAKFLYSSSPKVRNEELIDAHFIAAQFSQSSLVFYLLEKSNLSENVSEVCLARELRRFIGPKARNSYWVFVMNKILSGRFKKEDFLLFFMFGFMCAYGKLTTVIEFAKKHKAQIINSLSCALEEACGNGRLAVVKFLVNYYPFILLPHSKASLIRAAESNHLEIVHYLCRHHLLSVYEHNLFDELIEVIEVARSNGHGRIWKYLWILLMTKVMILDLFVRTWHKLSSVRGSRK